MPQNLFIFLGFLDCSLFFHGNKSSGCQFSGKRFDFFGAEFYHSVFHGKKSIIFSSLDVTPRVKFSSSLPDNYLAGRNFFTAKFFNTQSFGY